MEGQFVMEKEGDVKKNTGISILRLFLCFEVFYNHYSTEPDTIIEKVANLFRGIPVPCFIFLSFYLTYQIFDTQNKRKLMNRLKRLFYPLVFWNLIYYLYHWVHQGELLSYEQLIYSFILGAVKTLDFPLWYLSSEIMIIGILWMLSERQTEEENRNIIIFTFIGVFAVFMVVTGCNYYLFNGMPFESIFTFGRTLEIVPMAVLGYIYAEYENRLKKSFIYITALLLVVVSLILRYTWVDIKFGFGYQFVWQNILSIAIVLLFINLPQIRSVRLARIINYVAQFTMGAYCLQVMVCSILLEIGWLHIYAPISSLWFDIVSYVCCMLIAFLLYLASKKVPILRYMVI